MTACFDVESLVDDMIAASVGTEQGNGYVGENQLKPMKIHSKWYVLHLSYLLHKVW